MFMKRYGEKVVVLNFIRGLASSPGLVILESPQSCLHA